MTVALRHLNILRRVGQRDDGCSGLRVFVGSEPRCELIAHKRYRMKGIRFSAGSLLIVLATAACQQSRLVGPSPNSTPQAVHQESPPQRDSWESDPTQLATNPSCVELDRSLVAPVPAVTRADAVAKLDKVSAVALNENETAAILDLKSGVNEASARGRIKSAIAKLEEQKRLELEQRIGSWGPLDEERLAKLQNFGSSGLPAKLMPYLVRGIAKNEFTGGFYVTKCGYDIFVGQGSLGHSVPPSIRLPVIVFLDHLPTNVYVGWAMAE
jgi:hypothetical protein